jgi:signal transduction histidine kinase
MLSHSTQSSREVLIETPRVPTLQVTSAAFLTIVIFCGLVWYLEHSRRLVKTFQQRDIEIERVCGRITHLDEVLTMSARMGAATGDPAWQTRYLEHVKKLDVAIALAASLAPDTHEVASSVLTEAANQRLVEFESEAFRLVNLKQADAALDLLSGAEYEAQKSIYARGVREYLGSMRSRIADQLQTETWRLELGLASLVPVCIILLALWASAIRGLRIHLALLEETRNQAHEQRQRAEHASRAKSDFLATMSHEIRTPMNGILGALTLLADSESDSERVELTRLASTSARALLTVINDVLDFSKIEAGKIDLDSEPTDLTCELEDVLQLFVASSDEHGVTLSLNHEGHESLWVLADSGRMRQVILNLVGNAVKFSKGGNVEIRSIARLCEPDAIHLRVEVIDDGIGIKAEHLEKIFARFSQAEETTTQEFGGTGLGLAICRRLIELMDGTIGVESAPGEGSLFWFELDLPVAQQLDVDVSDQSSELFDCRVLVVDDNAVNRLIAERMLVRLGCEVDLAEDGADAVEAVQKKDYDLIFMDCQMPVLDGWAATRRIRALEDRFLKIPIIALTADALPDNWRRCEEAGMSDFIAKPIPPNTLRIILERWL